MKLECEPCRGSWEAPILWESGLLRLHLKCPQYNNPTLPLHDLATEDLDLLDRLFDRMGRQVHEELSGSVFVPFMDQRWPAGIVDAGIIDSLALTYSHVLLLGEDLGHKSPAMERALRYAEQGLITLVYRTPLMTIPQLLGDTRRVTRAPKAEDLASFEMDLDALAFELIVDERDEVIPFAWLLDLLVSYEANRFIRYSWPEVARVRGIPVSAILGSGLPGLVGTTALNEILGSMLQSATVLPGSVRAWSAYSRGLEAVGIPSADVVEDIRLWWSRTIRWPEASDVSHVLEMREAGGAAEFVNTALSAAACSGDDPDVRRQRVQDALSRRVEAARWVRSGDAALYSCAVAAGLAGLGALLGGGAGATVGAISTAPPLLLEIARRRVGGSWVAHFLT